MPLPPLREFLRTESASGVALLGASVVAIVWANLPGESYETFWHTTLITLDLRHWVNDGLMTLFFLLVGLEIKRELVTGELNSPRAAALPVVAAIGGVLLPIAVFTAVLRGGPGSAGWGIPIATDVAFAVGVLALVGRHAPDGLRLLLLSIAIVDDIIAITVIAVFYTDDLSPVWLGGAALCVLAIVVLRGFRVAAFWPFLPLGAALWFATLQSGVHATLAGVVLALLCPARPVRGRDYLPVLEHRLHPFVAFGIVPLFALANAGVALGGAELTAPLTLAVLLGLLVGKTFGIAGATLAATRLGPLALPAGVRTRHVWGMAILAAIGFTVSLFIADLSLDSADLIDQAKIGILAASALAGLLGALVLRVWPTSHHNSGAHPG
ncbi:MAG TPA: Na+/H+ antiporter NhaA [Actinophytocola sp.]|uniref:Na+/H+ antiporter NhaA n=1 Tax=Actinophytocola sp. TaxID=1872138 RepID=UPI002DB56E56|nr:Na+/H+ antiporter NhaA [Actinophytocola sp.]HEU5470543.1 Na+/H+ antiporter NhaA [Actinophytocola sp.]